MKTYVEMKSELEQYKQDKWNELVNSMEIGKPYTREELSEMSGFFSKQFISGRISGYGDCRIDYKKETLITNYVEVLPNGKVNRDNMITIEREKTFYTRTF